MNNGNHDYLKTDPIMKLNQATESINNVQTCVLLFQLLLVPFVLLLRLFPRVCSVCMCVVLTVGMALYLLYIWACCRYYHRWFLLLYVSAFRTCVSCYCHESCFSCCCYVSLRIVSCSFHFLLLLSVFLRVLSYVCMMLLSLLLPRAFPRVCCLYEYWMGKRYTVLIPGYLEVKMKSKKISKLLPHFQLTSFVHCEFFCHLCARYTCYCCFSSLFYFCWISLLCLLLFLGHTSLNIYLYVCIYMHVWMAVCMYACLYECIFVSIYECIHV